ncbi:hypothetical protein FC826_14675 [Clostridium botulinum]|uniref:DUF4209 domain-containing protein n=1 Tax=Clostridium botulinum TaxID=1491 RepID=A0A6B4TMA1_CLOBO|nr:hypothetical protein [Clostridium botulinum]NFD85622.1 hypothetical protein [Clostridium botulinum]NFE08821.1 hypothetical protein [Clostridium botulinum]NFE34911.1 hypothetical protein [Clostridium botulinum]NFE49794.1 hypothetical protein [Clostridium botulinum]
MSNNVQNNPFFVPKDNYLSIVICGDMYLISTHFSLNDAKAYLICLEDDENPKKAIATVIHKKLTICEEPIPTIEEIMNEDESIFSDFIFAIVNDGCEELKNYFDKTDASLSVTQRFAIAYRNYYNYYTQKLKDAVRTSLEQFELIHKSIDFSWVNKVQQIINGFQPTWIENIRQASRIGEKTAKIIFPIQNVINEYARTFSDLIANIKIPTISLEDKERLVENHKKWGTIGWSIIPNAPINLFSSNLINVNKANANAMQYCKPKDIEELFSRLREQKIKKADLNEAIFCYIHKQYKSCALLLFGIIDAKMIRKQPKQANKRRPVGVTAVRKLKERFETENDAESILFLLLNYVNLISCLETMFANGNDFKKEPMIINRNFVGHGMSTRHVRKRDCIQLFLVLYNLTDFLDSL